MLRTKWCRFIIVVAVIHTSATVAYINPRSLECGPYGFVCEGNSKLRLCEGENLLGPAFLCPPNSLCNEDSSDVCESIVNYVDPAIRAVRCRRNERIADPSVPDCKGYILCIPNKNHFQGIKFTCTGNTIFNGITRTCSSPERYKCPLKNTTKPINRFDLFENNRRSGYQPDRYESPSFNRQKPRPIDCKNYKLTVTQERSPAKAAYFCPSKQSSGGIPIKCTVFSSNFCIILEKDEDDQFIQNTGAAFRRPRILDDIVDVQTDDDDYW